MTRDEILDMPAGREMDALVAEKVMGWESDNRDPDGVWYYNNKYGLIGVDKYSTDIAATWQVVEKMITQPMFVELIHDGMMWICIFDDNINEYKASDFAAPLAICRAALLAVQGL